MTEPEEGAAQRMLHRADVTFGEPSADDRR